MKKQIIFLFFGIILIFLVGTISAANIETDYYISQEKVLVKHFFDSASDLELRLPKDFTALEINSEYQLEEFSKYYSIKINSANNLSISYLTQSMVDKSKDRYSFVSRNYLNESQNVR